ncbi:MAG TPA: hypothetical protein VMS93_11400 [Candidatus Saccharimonadales bacterium]|nr:hypothetical protein [Candidatus Saccharimonadales bacterium]
MAATNSQDPPRPTVPRKPERLVHVLCRRLKAMLPSCARCHRRPTLACALRTLGRDCLEHSQPSRPVPPVVRIRLRRTLKTRLKPRLSR